MKLCINIPDVKILVAWQGCNIKSLLDLAEKLLPYVPAHADYVYTVLHAIQMEYLGVTLPGDIPQHSLFGVGPNHIAFFEACRHFYYVESNLPDIVDLLAADHDLAGSQLIVQRTKFMIVDQG